MLKLASPQFTDQALAAVEAVLRSGQLIQGEWVRRFEAALAEYLGLAHVVAVSSGTAALHLALVAAGVRPGDDVLVPAFTFPATANAVVHAGGRPRLVDVSADDLCMDARLIEAALTDRTRFILPVHEFGQSADMKAIMAIAARHGLTVIEDAACALGAAFETRPVGTFGICGCFSFHPRKSITTGEGGAVSTSDPGLAENLRMLRNHGIRSTPQGNDFVAAGLNYRLTEFQAVLGYHQMCGFGDTIARRIRQAELYSQLLADIPGLTLPRQFDDRRAVFQTYHVVLPAGVSRADVIASLLQQGVETNLGAQALNCLSFFREAYGYRDESCPVASRLFQRGLALPLGAHCADVDLERVAAALRRVLAG
jgi:perosamine synthetase